jgi:hypothetical protein
MSEPNELMTYVLVAPAVLMALALWALFLWWMFSLMGG